MFRLCLAAWFPVVVLLFPPLVSAQDKPTTFLPLKVGNKWTYKIEVGGQSLETVQKVVKIEKKDGKEIATLEVEIGGQTLSEQTSSDEKGIFRYSIQGMPIEPPVQALKLPFKKGETWEAKFTAQGQETKVAYKSEAEEEVSVPAGKYKTVMVSAQFEVMGQQFSAKIWYAPGVGIVKQSFDFGGGGSFSSELVKFEQAK